MFEKNTISVVMPNFNHGRYLEESVTAILNQSHKPLELIIIDDFSEDDSLEILEKLAKNNPIIKIIKKLKNTGIINSMNIGLNMSRGEYIYHCAADDRVEEQFFFKAISLLQKYPSAGIFSALVRRIDEVGSQKEWIRTPVISNKEIYLNSKNVLKYLDRYGFWFAGQSVIYRRKFLVEAIGYYSEKLKHRVDHFADYLVAIKHGAVFSPEILSTYRLLSTGYAETQFRDVESSLSSFKYMISQMRNEKYNLYFPAKFIDTLEKRDGADIHYRALKDLLNQHIEYINNNLIDNNNKYYSISTKIFLNLMTINHKIQSVFLKVYFFTIKFNFDYNWLFGKIIVRFRSPKRFAN